MGRLLLAAVAAVAIFFLLRTLLGKRKLSVAQFFALYAAALAVVVLIGLGLTGRLHPVTASLGVVLAMFVRALPVMMRLFQAVNLFGKPSRPRWALPASRKALNPAARVKSRVRSLP